MGSEAGVFYALDAATGELLWSRETAIGGWAAPAAVDGVLYAESSDGYLLALDAVAGEDIWAIPEGLLRWYPVRDHRRRCLISWFPGRRGVRFHRSGEQITSNRPPSYKYWEYKP